MLWYSEFVFRFHHRSVPHTFATENHFTNSSRFWFLFTLVFFFLLLLFIGSIMISIQSSLSSNWVIVPIVHLHLHTSRPIWRKNSINIFASISFFRAICMPPDCQTLVYVHKIEYEKFHFNIFFFFSFIPIFALQFGISFFILPILFASIEVHSMFVLVPMKL